MKKLFLLSFGITVALLSGCSGQNLSKDANSPTTVNLEQDFQEVVTTDCTGKVVSDQIQSVSSPSQLVTISAKNPSTVAGSRFLNQSTGSTAPLVTGYTTFYVDHGDGALSMHVITGGNVISYTFYSCTQYNADGSCGSAQTIQEQGTLTLMVNYTEKTRPGVLTMSNCVTPSPTPVPGS